MTEFEDYDFYEEIEGSREEYKYFEKAKNDIVDLYEKDKEAVYYLRQL